MLSILLHSGFLATCPCPEKQSVPWIHCIEYIFFIIQGFWATCVCLKKQSCPDIFHCIEIFFSFRIFEQLALALKNTSCPEIFHCIEIFLSFRIFEQLSLALKTEFALKSRYWICIFYHSGFRATCACPEKHKLPWNFSLYWNIFIIQDFWATCAWCENIVCPEIFQDGGAATPDPRLVCLCPLIQCTSNQIISKYSAFKAPRYTNCNVQVLCLQRPPSDTEMCKCSAF